MMRATPRSAAEVMERAFDDLAPAPATEVVIIGQFMARIAALEAELKQATAKAHREDRVAAITLRVVDRRASWAARMGLRHGQRGMPQAVITTRQVILCD